MIMKGLTTTGGECSLQSTGGGVHQYIYSKMATISQFPTDSVCRSIYTYTLYTQVHIHSSSGRRVAGREDSGHI